jgi:putative colanic acid biosysnthesis UDP-glucose lipid carrier transferase
MTLHTPLAEMHIEPRAIKSVSKRVFDIVLAAVILVFLLPAMGLVAILIKLDTPGPVFFRQRRTGLNRKSFEILKFRTMSCRQDTHLPAQAKRNDPRITRIGALLRRTSLDELPQLINVLKGDMSLVGPRPHAETHDAEFAALVPNYALRFAVRPGLTGLAQMQGYRGEIKTYDDISYRIALDLEYIANWSILNDIKIIFMTLPCLLGHHKAY